MRRARSYSIVDHRLLHGGYFQKLSHRAMALYLFLVVVGDPEGKSFYVAPTLDNILHFQEGNLQTARDELVALGLISYRKPYWWVCPLSEPITSKDPIRKRVAEPETSKTSQSIGTLVADLAQRMRIR